MPVWMQLSSATRRVARVLPLVMLVIGCITLLFLARIVAQDANPATPLSTVPPLPTVSPAPAVPLEPAADIPAMHSVGDATPEGMPTPGSLAAETGSAGGTFNTTAIAEGWLSILYADDFGNGQSERLFRLLTDDGASLWLTMDEAWFDARGGAAQFDGKRVEVTLGDLSAANAGPPRVMALELQPIADISHAGANATSPDAPQAKTLRYVNLLCLFPDRTSNVPAPAEIAAWSNGGTGSLSDYFHTVSYGNLRIEFTTFAQWRTMPVNNDDVTAKREWVDAVTDNCPQLFWGDVNFDLYDGVQFFTNGTTEHDGYGGMANIAYGGKTRLMPTTWFVYGTNHIFTHVVTTHEIGHSMGRMHSNNFDGDSVPYDNFWDLMSGSDYGVLNGRDPCWFERNEKGINTRRNCIADGMASVHRLELGWIAPSRVYTVSAGTDATVQLDWLSLAGTTTNYGVIKIPINDGNYFTVEARTAQTDSYDRMLPGTGVIIHEVIRNRTDPAWQVGATSDEASREGGGVWLPGETYVNDQWKFSVEVLDRTDTGYRLRLKHTGLPAVWNPDLWLRYSSLETGNGEVKESFVADNRGGPASEVYLKIEQDVAKLPWDSSNKPFVKGILVVTGMKDVVCSGDQVIFCKLPNLPPNSQHKFTVTLRATEDGMYSIKRSLVAREFVPTGTKHVLEGDYPLNAVADVVVQITPPLTLYSGRPVTPNILVSHMGGSTITVTVAITMPSAFVVSSINLTKTKVEAQCEIVASGVLCTIPEMHHGALLQVRLQLRPTATYRPGRYGMDATALQVSDWQANRRKESDLSNNHAHGVICGEYCTTSGASGPLLFLPQVRSR